MKHILVMAGFLGLAGCAQTPEDVKNTSKVLTEKSSVPYKLLGQCLQQRLRNVPFFGFGMTWDHELRFQDWVPEAELVAGTHQDTAYVATLRPLDDSSTLIELHPSPNFMGFEVERIVSKFKTSLVSCESLIQSATK